VKVKPFRVPRSVIATVAQGRTVLRGGWELFCTGKLLALGIILFALALGLLIWPHDRQLLETIHWWCRGHRALAREVAWYLGTLGDYPTYNVPLALAIWLYGVASKSVAWRRVAVICFLGATLAGLFDDCFRLTLGRPRPDAHMPDGLYGITYAFRCGVCADRDGDSPRASHHRLCRRGGVGADGTRSPLSVGCRCRFDYRNLFWTVGWAWGKTASSAAVTSRVF
jgi:hypothetical protein